MIQSRQLEAFRAVMLTGGMTMAADLVRITQPAISRLIRGLEDELGLRLFERSGNRLRPTREAGILFGEVSRHFTGIEHINKVATELRESHKRLNILTEHRIPITVTWEDTFSQSTEWARPSSSAIIADAQTSQGFSPNPR